MRTVSWVDGRVRLVDQKKIPWESTTVDFDNYRDVANAITDMTVRGAPAIGATAAFGMALAARNAEAEDMNVLIILMHEAAAIMKAARPTAVNLAWAVDQMMEIVESDAFTNPDDGV